jgi:O-antigen ligase
MLTYVVICITAYLVLEILRAPRSADATGYLLVSGLIPLPLYIIGNSAAAAVSAIDVCLFAYVLAHGKSALQYVLEHRALSAGVGALFGFSILATCSGVFNFLFFDPSALKFYIFTIAKFWEYASLATLLIASRPDALQLRRICTIVLAGILVYEILHVLHISGLVPLSGEAYFGPQAAEFNAGEKSYAPFSDRTAWFLTSSRIVIGGTASISAWLSLMVFEAYRGKIKVIAAAAAIMSVFSVLAVSSRSDIAGLAVASIVFALFAPPRRLKAYVCAGVAVAGVYLAFVTLVLPPAEQATAMTRMSELWNPELRAEGDYADRSSDRASMLSYLPEHPRELLIGVGPGNFHWYMDHRITYNFFGHNSYLHWTGELGIGGLLLLLGL